MKHILHHIDIRPIAVQAVDRQPQADVQSISNNFDEGDMKI
jgi:hypothetical protein